MMHLNILHRTAEPVFYDIFRRQQELVHEHGLRATVFLKYGDLFDEEALKDVRADRDEHGDEIGLSLHGLGGPGLDDLSVGLNMIWLHPLERKRKILQVVLEKWREVFGESPVSVASYHFDSSSLHILKELAPEVEAVVGGCFEEGVRVFHGCNNSWYLFNEGMPWWPWYPSRTHSLRPARDEQDAAGVVAVPHLCRDMSLAYEGRNDFWASHPPNVIRGLGNHASFCPYDLNLIDQYRMQERWNGGHSYYNTFVSAPWLTWHHNSEWPPEVPWELYCKFIGYLADLKSEGELRDETMAEYAAWHREHRPLDAPEPQVYWAKEMLYGSGKHYLWYLDPDQRVLIDACQGGSIGDLRPYVGNVEVATGPDTPHMEIGSYPYLIHSQHRTGYPNHCYDGSRTTFQVTHGEETVDLATCRTEVADVERTEEGVRIALTPAGVEFEDGLRGVIETTYLFRPEGRTLVERRLAEVSDPGAELLVTEYFKGCFGTTEYPEPLHEVTLAVDGDDPAELSFEYLGHSIQTAGATAVSARVPMAGTLVELRPDDGPALRAAAADGHLYNPYYILSLEYRLRSGESVRTWMSLSEEG